MFFMVKFEKNKFIMKKTILFSATLMCLILVMIVSSCKKNPSGEKWLNGIFECSNGSGFCLPDEPKVFTEQYLNFYQESLEIYEYPEFETEEKQMSAEIAFKNRWKNSYSLHKDIWPPFGRGNGMEAGYKLENVTINHLFDLIFSVIIDYGDDEIFFNTLKLIPSADAFSIDYIETISIDSDREEGFIPFLQNFSLAKFQLGSNPLDAKRLLGKPKSESAKTGPVEVSGQVDEDYIVTTTTLEFDGIRLVYEDDRMIHALIDKSGKSFGWIIIGDKKCNKDFLREKFCLEKDDFYEGDKIIIMNWEIISLLISLDENGLVNKIEMNSGS